MIDDNTRDAKIKAHYFRLWGEPNRKFSFAHPSDKAPSPLFVYEFAGDAQDSTFVYATLGASHKAMVHPNSQGEARMELFILCNQDNDELIDNLGSIAVYPFVMQTYFGEGHTVNGIEGHGIVTGSPLTDLIITRADYSDTPDYITHTDGSHTHLFWVVPIYHTEREYVVKNGWRNLQELFEQQQTDVLDFWRAAVV